MKQKLVRFAAAGSLIVVMGLSILSIPASAKTTNTAASSKKTTLGKVTIAPKLVSGTQYKMTIKKGNTNYVVTFDTATAKVVNHKDVSIAATKIVVGNKIQVKGLVNTSSKKITKVSKVKDDSLN